MDTECAEVAKVNLQELKQKSVEIRLEQLLGTGAFSEVYSATYEGQHCAAKVLHGSVPEHSEPDGAREVLDCLTLEHREANRVGEVSHGESDGVREVLRCLASKQSSPHQILHDPAMDSASETAQIIQRFGSASQGQPEAVRRAEQLWRECQITRTMKHPCIVQHLATVMQPESGLLVLLMERAVCNLTTHLRAIASPLQQLELARDITSAVAYLHQHHILHRDLSSNNILVCTGGRAKVSDFGAAIELEGSERTLTPIPGTMQYMPPEALPTAGQQCVSYGYKLDIFSLGVLIVQICTRKYPKPRPPVRHIHVTKRATVKRGVRLSEWERRQAHIKLISRTNPLLPLALRCLRDREVLRPSALELSNSVQATLVAVHRH